MPITWKNLGDYMAFTGQVPAGFVTGRTGQLVPQARADAQASINAEALRQRAIEADWKRGMVLPNTSPPMTYSAPAQAQPQAGLYPPGCCPTELSLPSPFVVTATDLDVTPPAMRYFVGDMIPGATPVIQKEQVSVSADPVNAVVIKSQTIPVSSLVGRPSPAAMFVPQQARQAVQARARGVDHSLATLERAALMPQNLPAQAVPQTFAGLGATREWGDAEKKNAAKLVKDAELTWAQYTAGQRTLPANFKTNLEYLRGELARNNFDSSYLPEVFGGWPSAADLRARISRLQNLMIQRERPGAIAPGVVDARGNVRQDSPARAAAQSLEQDAAAAAAAAARAARDLADSKRNLMIGAGVLGALGVAAWAYGKGRR